MSRKRTSREAMRSWVRRFERSGLSAARFCRRHGFPAHRLSYWRRVASEALRGGREARAERATLAPVRLLELAGPASGGGLEIQLVSGDRLIVRERVAVELLRETLSVLRGGC